MALIIFGPTSSAQKIRVDPTRVAGNDAADPRGPSFSLWSSVAILLVMKVSWVWIAEESGLIKPAAQIAAEDRRGGWGR